MIRIQKIKNILSILFFSLLSVSCQEWLDVSPSTEIKYDDLFSYKNGFKDQLTGVYTTLCSENLYGVELSFGMLDVLGQQYYLWTPANGPYYNLHRFEYDTQMLKPLLIRFGQICIILLPMSIFCCKV